jgi:hypothetical protein
MSGGTAAVMVIGVGAAGAAAYLLLKNKPAAAASLQCVASSLASSVQVDANTAYTDCDEGGSGSCQTDDNTVEYALTAYCACAPYSALSTAVQGLVSTLGIPLPSNCGN